MYKDSCTQYSQGTSETKLLLWSIICKSLTV